MAHGRTVFFPLVPVRQRHYNVAAAATPLGVLLDRISEAAAVKSPRRDGRVSAGGDRGRRRATGERVPRACRGGEGHADRHARPGGD
jgi:hypothetical protein